MKLNIDSLEKIINYVKSDDWYGISEDERAITSSDIKEAYKILNYIKELEK